MNDHLRGGKKPDIERNEQVAKPLRLVIVGCGNIANGYGQSLQPHAKVYRFIASIVDTSLSQTAADGQSVQIWDTRNSTLVRTLLTGLKNGPADQIAWSLDGKYIAVTEESLATHLADYDDVYVWNASTGQLALHFKPLKNNPNHLVSEPDWNGVQGERIAWSPDSALLATVTSSLDSQAQQESDMLRIWGA